MRKIKGLHLGMGCVEVKKCVLKSFKKAHTKLTDSSKKFYRSFCVFCFHVWTG